MKRVEVRFLESGTIARWDGTWGVVEGWKSGRRRFDTWEIGLIGLDRETVVEVPADQSHKINVRWFEKTAARSPIPLPKNAG